MKNLKLNLIAASACLVPSTVLASVDLSSIEAQIDEALVNMEVLSASGSVTPADIAGMGDLMDDFFDADRPVRPSSVHLRQAIDVYLDELQTRARNAWIKQTHVAFLRQQVVEAQLDLVLQELIFRARNTGWTPSHFQAVRAQLIARADVAIDAPSSRYLRRQFERLANQATTRAQNAFSKKLEKYQLEVIEFRLDNALSKLREQRKGGELSRVGFNRVVTLLHRQARAAAAR